MKTFIATYLLDKEGDLSKTDKPMVEKIRDKIEYVFDKANDYERIKEKLIGETFEYVPEFSYIINGILMRYENNPDLIRFLRENTNYIISTFNKSGTRNLRILKHALNDFKKIYEIGTISVKSSRKHRDIGIVLPFCRLEILHQPVPDKAVLSFLGNISITAFKHHHIRISVRIDLPVVQQTLIIDHRADRIRGCLLMFSEHTIELGRSHIKHGTAVRHGLRPYSQIIVVTVCSHIIREDSGA